MVTTRLSFEQYITGKSYGNYSPLQFYHGPDLVSWVPRQTHGRNKGMFTKLQVV